MRKFAGLCVLFLSICVKAEINFDYQVDRPTLDSFGTATRINEYHEIRDGQSITSKSGVLGYAYYGTRKEFWKSYGHEYTQMQLRKSMGMPYEEMDPIRYFKVYYKKVSVDIKYLVESEKGKLSQGPAQDDYWGCLHERPLFKIYWPNLKKIETAETDRQNSEYAVLITGDGDGGNMGGPVTGATNSLYMNIIDHSGVIVTKEPMLNVSYASYPLIDYELESEFFFDAYGIPIGSNREDLIPEDNIDLGAGRKGYGKLFAQDFNENGQQDLIFWHRIYKSHKAVKDPKTKEWDTSKRYFDFEREWFTWYEEDSTQDGFTEHKLTTEQAKQWLSDNQLGWNDGYPKDNSQCKYEGVRKIPMMTGVYDPELKPYQK
jgi:hypothetical protein